MARQFSPQQGRWQSPDLFAGSYNWADPQSLNRYAYVNDRPMWATDPSGQFMLANTGPASPSIWAEMAPLEAAVGWAEGIFEAADLLTDFLNRSNFHGSLEGQKRPAANPWDDRFGVPYGGLGSSVGQALGLPTGGCEFGACGNIPGSNFQAGAETLPAAGTGAVVCAASAPACVLGGLTVASLAFAARLAQGVPDSVLQQSLQSPELNSLEECTERYFAEQDRCRQRFGSGGRFGSNRPKGACLDRAFYRYQACLADSPDPGPPMATLHQLPSQGSSPDPPNLLATAINSKLIWGKAQ
jgi:hypothetical protein